MFEPFYGFTQTPFTRAVAPAALFQSEQHQELLARLRYLVQSRYLQGDGAGAPNPDGRWLPEARG